VLHIATLHYNEPRWIEHISVPYRTWTALGDLDPSYALHFDRVIDQGGRHSDRLNHLALEISHDAADSDLLMFLDGDAFPIADPMPLITDGLAKAPMIAVRREENDGDKQPHPCFCVTTVGTWRSLPGDWSCGYRWPNASGGHVTDVGGNLLRTLELTKTPWVEVLRSNRKDLDPLFFAVYGDTVYHHGAGFHIGQLPRVHLVLEPRRLPVPRVPVGSWLIRRINWERKRIWERRTSRSHVRMSKLVLERIQRGGSDWLAEFI
jgi:hypothetical protein